MCAGEVQKQLIEEIKGKHGVQSIGTDVVGAIGYLERGYRIGEGLQFAVYEEILRRSIQDFALAVIDVEPKSGIETDFVWHQIWKVKARDGINVQLRTADVFVVQSAIVETGRTDWGKVYPFVHIRIDSTSKIQIQPGNWVDVQIRRHIEAIDRCCGLLFIGGPQRGVVSRVYVATQVPAIAALPVWKCNPSTVKIGAPVISVVKISWRPQKPQIQTCGI